MSLAHVGLKGNERDWALSPHKELFRLYLCRTELSQSAKSNLLGRGEGRGLGCLCIGCLQEGSAYTAPPSYHMVM